MFLDLRGDGEEYLALSGVRKVKFINVSLPNGGASSGIRITYNNGDREDIGLNADRVEYLRGHLKDVISDG